jgi:hypothetical protein
MPEGKAQQSEKMKRLAGYGKLNPWQNIGGQMYEHHDNK